MEVPIIWMFQTQNVIEIFKKVKLEYKTIRYSCKQCRH